jgi:hypothetical protein
MVSPTAKLAQVLGGTLPLEHPHALEKLDVAYAAWHCPHDSSAKNSRNVATINLQAERSPMPVARS